MSIQKFITDIVNKNIVRSSNKVGVGGFLFDVATTDEVGMSADITDHYVEENYSVQDHIALRPKIVTIRGIVGELIDEQEQAMIQALTTVQTLATVGGLAPKYSAQVTQAYEKINDVVGKVNTVLSQANSVFDIFYDRSSPQNNQQRAFAFFQQVMDSRELLTVDTPYQTFENMAIMDLRVLQRDESRMVTDFSVMLKQIRTVDLLTETVAVASGRVANAISSNVAAGKVQGKVVDIDVKIIGVYAGR